MKCPACEGKGHRITQNGPDDVDHDVCDWCEGSGGKVCIECDELNDSDTSVTLCQECESEATEGEYIDWCVKEFQGE